MSKDTPFFKFDSSAWLGGSIQFTDLECKGLFIDLCAIYWETKKPVQIDTKLKVRTRCPEGTLSNLIGTLSDLNIIDQSEHGITIPFLDFLINERNEWLKKCSEAGKKGHAVQGTSSNKKEERRKKRVERREEKEDKKIKTRLRFTPPTLEEVKSYFSEKGYTELSAKKAFDYYQSANWKDARGNQVKNWKQKMISVWFKPENEKKSDVIKSGWGLK